MPSSREQEGERSRRDSCPPPLQASRGVGADDRFQAKGAARRCGRGTTSGMSSCMGSDSASVRTWFTSDQIRADLSEADGCVSETSAGRVLLCPRSECERQGRHSDDAHRHGEAFRDLQAERVAVTATRPVGRCGRGTRRGGGRRAVGCSTGGCAASAPRRRGVRAFRHERRARRHRRNPQHRRRPQWSPRARPRGTPRRRRTPPARATCSSRSSRPS